MKSGQRVLIHGGAGGVGHLAIQIAKAKGAWVATTCSGEDLDFVRSICADEPIDYKAEKFEDRLSGIDLVYDLVAGETQERSFKVLKQGRALISTLQEPDKAKALYKNIKIAHSAHDGAVHTLGIYVREMNPTDQASLANARRWIAVIREMRRQGVIESDYSVGYFIKSVKNRFNLVDTEYDAELERLNIR